MEKTINIVIASTQFPLEERAYEALRRYLGSLRAQFATPEGEEILRDIESRIAEKLLGTRHAVITDADVGMVMAEMGAASELGEEPAAAPLRGGTRKLYRDRDGAVIGGVAAGISAYFDIDPVFARVLFVVSAFFGGAGVPIYLLLWILLPAASTASQKLQMRGDAVTLDAIKRLVHERADEVRERGTFKKLLYFPFEVLGAVLRFFADTLLPVAGRALGVLCAVGAFFGAIGFTILLGSIVFNWNSPLVDLPVREAISPALWWTVIAAGYLAFLIPLVLVFALGARLVRGRSLMPTSVGLGLIGLWALALVVSGVSGVRIASNYYAYTSTSPAYQEITKTLAPGAFKAVDIKGKHVTLKSGPAYSVELKGLPMDMDNLAVELADGTLSVRPDFKQESCIFCRRATPSVTIVAPGLDAVALDGASISFDGYADEALALTMRGSSARGSLQVGALTLKADNSYAELEGSAQSAGLSLANARFSGESFAMQATTLSAVNSSVVLDSAAVPTVTKNQNSRIEDAEGHDLSAQE